MTPSDRLPPLEPEDPRPGDWGEYRRLVLGKLGNIDDDLKSTNEKLAVLEALIKADFVDRKYFEAVFLPVRNIVYGAVGIMLTAMLAAFVVVVLK